jgi:hypothetical protein
MLKDIRSGDKAKDILKGQNPVQIFSVKGKDRTTLEGKTLGEKKSVVHAVFRLYRWTSVQEVYCSYRNSVSVLLEFS